jgi:hypothetical protein
MRDNTGTYPNRKMTQNKNIPFDTSDKTIRPSLRSYLENKYQHNKSVAIIDVNHGSARVDMAVMDGIIHGYEIKSDKDSLMRLPLQIEAYNAVFSSVTIVTGRHHLEAVIDIVPEWWGILLAKTGATHTVLTEIRDCLPNDAQDPVALARLLWREEALGILQTMGEDKGFRSQPRGVIYKKLASLLDVQELQELVQKALFTRADQRVVSTLAPNGD